MFAAAEELRFEYAAKLRDEIKELRRELQALAESRIVGAWRRLAVSIAAAKRGRMHAWRSSASTSAAPSPTPSCSIEGALTTAKVPTRPAQEESVVAGGRARARAAGRRPPVERFTHGTTVATNALLERKGARTAFVTTEGFEHLLHLRRQNRAHLYRLDAGHPEPLVPLERCLGVSERIGPDGVVVGRSSSIRSPSSTPRRSPSASCSRSGIPRTSRPVGGRASPAATRDAHVVASHEVAPEFREFERASTTVVDAYLGPGRGAVPRLARRVRRRQPVSLRAARDALLRGRCDDRAKPPPIRR